LEYKVIILFYSKIMDIKITNNEIMK